MAEPVAPAGSQIVYERLEDGEMVTIPPPGIRRGDKWAFYGGIIWCWFTFAGTIVLIFGEIMPRGSDWRWTFARFLATWGIGSALLYLAFMMGRRQAAVAIVGDTVMAMEAWPLHSRIGEWRGAEVAAIRVGDSGVRKLGFVVWQLEIVFKNGNTFSLLIGRRVAELNWMAAELNEALVRRIDPFAARRSS